MVFSTVHKSLYSHDILEVADSCAGVAHAKLITVTDAKPNVASCRWATLACNDLTTSSTYLTVVLEHCIVHHPNHVFVSTICNSLKLVPL